MKSESTNDKYRFNLGHVLTDEQRQDPAIKIVTEYTDRRGQEIMIIKCTQLDIYHGLVNGVVKQPCFDADGMLRWLGHMSHCEPATAATDTQNTERLTLGDKVIRPFHEH